jgi:electron transport complex protein RnfG
MIRGWAQLGLFEVGVGIGIALSAVILTLVTAGQIRAQTTREKALERLFPGAAIEAQRVFLTEAQRERAEALSGVGVDRLLIARYVATQGDRLVGVAYIDTHVVRTKNESLLISLNPDRTVRRVEVTAFLEPPEYMASEAWYAQYESKVLSDDLNLQRAIRPIAGASLTGRATNEAVRRVLAIDQALSEDSSQ